MRRLGIGVATLLLLLGSTCRGDGVRPNIVVLLIDDLGSADCGFAGGTDIRTPNIDALAARGATFRNFYVQPLCSATRAPS